MKRLLLLLVALAISATLYAQSLRLNNICFFESPGVAIHIYDDVDGLSILLREQTLSINGGLKVSGEVPVFSVESRNVDLANDRIEVKLNNGSSTLLLIGESKGLGLSVSVLIEEPLPSAFANKLSFGLSLRPQLYLGKKCLVDGLPRVISYKNQAGNSVVLAPENEDLRLTCTSAGEISLSGSDVAVRLESEIPVEKSGKILEWYIEPSYNSSWARDAMPEISHIGYLCGQRKISNIEIGESDRIQPLYVYKVNADGHRQMVYQTNPKQVGENGNGRAHLEANFSFVKDPGLYCLEYGSLSTDAFPIDSNLCEGEWKDALKALTCRELTKDIAPELTLSLVRLWETFRPEDDLDVDGTPDVIALLEKCAQLLRLSGPEADIAALAAAGRVLQDFCPELAGQTLMLARSLWNSASARGAENLQSAAMQLWFATADRKYKDVAAQTTSFKERLELSKLMDGGFQRKVTAEVPEYAKQLKAEAVTNKLEWALDVFALWQKYPNAIEADLVLEGRSAVYGSRSFADRQMLDALTPQALSDFVRLSLACEEIARVLSR